MKRIELTKHHVLGIIIGLASPLIFIPIVIFVFSLIQNYELGRLWSDFKRFDAMQVKVITVSLLSNLIWFYRTLNKEFFNVGRGIIIGTLLFSPYIVYVKFF